MKCLENNGGKLESSVHGSVSQTENYPTSSTPQKSRSKSREARYKEKFDVLYQKYQSVKKSIKSYESAIDKLSKKREDERRERKAKD